MKNFQGFSLIEMAIVLIIIGFFLGGLLTPLSAQRDRQQIKRTLKTLEEVKEALLGFAVIHKRLPCSDRNGNGKESKNITDCESNGEGYLPWKDLGVGRYDGWGKPFRYRTEADFNEIPNISKSILMSGLRVKNRQDNNFTIVSSDSRVAAIIFSQGKNGVPDDDNANLLMKTFVYDGYVENEFDDILTWLPRNTLMSRLITAKRWP